jgi:mRNA interferase HigB
MRGKTILLSAGEWFSQKWKYPLPFLGNRRYYPFMLVIGMDIVERYFAERSGHRGIDAARAQYRAWLAIAEASDWRTPQQVKRSHPKASILKGGRVVFNIKANDYRLIAMVQYRDGVLMIRFFGSHEDYDKVDAETV